MSIQKLLLAASLTAVLGCSDAARPGDLAISIIPSRSLLKPGDTLQVSVTVMNVGDRMYTLTSGNCPSPIKVYGPDGSIVPRAEVCGEPGFSRVLEPGDSHTYAFRWTAETITYGGGMTVKSPLSAGPYGLRGQVTIAEVGVIEAGGVSIYILP